MMGLLIRIVTGFLSAYSFVLFGSIFWRHHSEFWIIALSAWLVAWIVLETVTACLKLNPLPRLLTHLRYAPISILLFFLAAVLAYDQAMIVHSRWKIRNYVYGTASPKISVSLELHNNYRGWCGNGSSATIYALYADTAGEGFESSDPAVRARSLSASIEVYDWLNGVSDGPFPELIARASNDPHPLVRKIAAEFRREAYGSGR